METSGPEDIPVGAKERKKIQFAVPSTAPTQLDPRQVEMCDIIEKFDSQSQWFCECISVFGRRRPTPATLFRVADQSSPEDDNSTHQQWVVGENGVLKPKRVNPNVYQPPSLKAVQQMAEAQMQKLGVYAHMEEEGEEPLEAQEEEQLLSCPTAPQEEMNKTDDQSDSSNPMVTERTEEEDEKDEDEEATEDESRQADTE